MRVVTLVLLALYTRAVNPCCRLTHYEGIAEGGVTTGQHRMRVTEMCECSFAEYKFARMLIISLEEMNRKTGVSLGYRRTNARGSLNTQALIGHSSSAPNQHINKGSSPFHVPQISHLSTCACLSNKHVYPSFLRTVPSDCFQVIALVQLMKHYGWNWVGIADGYGTYANQGTAEFVKQAKKEGICIALFLKKQRADSKMLGTENTLKTCRTSYLRIVLTKVERMNIPGKQWIGSESWITTANLATAERMEILQGAMGFAIPESRIPGLTELLLDLRPSDAPQSAYIRTFWEDAFHCSLSASACMSATLHCGWAGSAMDQAVDYLYGVLFAQAVNSPVMQKSRESYDKSIFHKDVFQPYQTLNLVCIFSSLLSKQKEKNQRPECCLKCSVCDNTIIRCQRDAKGKVPRLQLSWTGVQGSPSVSPRGVVLTVLSLLGIGLATSAAFLIYQQRDPPVSRASTSKLSILLLSTVTWRSLSPLALVGQQFGWSCTLRHTAFGITFVLCISCVLGKTIVVLMAFRATLPGSNIMKWFGLSQEGLSVLAITLMQVLVCVLWLTISPPFPYKNMKHYKEKNILECDVGSAVGFWAVLVYIGLLAALCFVMAFLAGNMPFTEPNCYSLNILVYVYMTAWTAIMHLFKTPGKYAVVVEIT